MAQKDSFTPKVLKLHFVSVKHGSASIWYVSHSTFDVCEFWSILVLARCEKLIMILSINEIYEKSACTFDLFFISNSKYIRKSVGPLSKTAKYLPRGEERGNAYGINLKAK